jgi:glutaredoxin
MLPYSAFAQKGTIIVEEVKSDTTIVLIGKNTSDQDQKIDFQLTSSGVKLSRKKSFSDTIPANAEIELIRMSPQPNKQWSYSYKHSHRVIQKEPPVSQPPATHPQPADDQRKVKAISPIVTEPTLSEIDPDKIIVFTKDGCGRCDASVKFLKQHHIEFEELNMKKKDNEEELKRYLFGSGFQGGQFTTPLIVAKGEVHYNIKDLQGFLEGLKTK